MNAFLNSYWIYKHCSSQLEQKETCRFIHDTLFLSCSFNPLNWTHTYTHTHTHTHTLLNKLQDHVFVYNIWINFGKQKRLLNFLFPKQFHAKHYKFKAFILC